MAVPNPIKNTPPVETLVTQIVRGKARLDPLGSDEERLLDAMLLAVPR
jgi:hypothetical protein